MNLLLIAGAKLFSWLIKTLNLGHGSTWPGHVILNLNKNFIRQTIHNSNVNVILVAGTNGKTTTARLLREILEEDGKKVIQNESGANLLNGIASTLALSANIAGRITADYAIFEVDENALRHIVAEISPHYIILLNLFRDQLDRYGEVHTIASRWKEALKKTSEKTYIIANADDPEIAYLGANKTNIRYFGLDETLSNQKEEHAADTMYCPNCGYKLFFKKRFFSHLGDWHCTKCGLIRPKLAISSYQSYPLIGTYNKYNVLAAVLTSQAVGVDDAAIEKAVSNFKPAFGRQEIIQNNGRQAQIFLSKNPTGFNESLRAIQSLHAGTLLLVLNDGIADGTDVSWIWDIDMDIITKDVRKIIISGTRCYDMGLRLKYEDYKNFIVIPNLKDALDHGFEEVGQKEMLYILPTYTAMLEIREVLTGKKIL